MTALYEDYSILPVSEAKRVARSLALQPGDKNTARISETPPEKLKTLHSINT
jgi:hypothetical protein